MVPYKEMTCKDLAVNLLALFNDLYRSRCMLSKYLVYIELFPGLLIQILIHLQKMKVQSYHVVIILIMQ